MWTMLRRKAVDKDQAWIRLQHQGWDEPYVKAWGEISKPRLSEQDLLTLMMRDDKSRNDVHSELLLRGWERDDIQDMRNFRDIIPSVNDLISMAVREGFNDSAATLFGYDQDYPDEINEWLEKQGLSRSWGKKYWRAHWNLPGIMQVFEMLHRLRPGRTDNPVTMSDVDQYLLAADFPSFMDRS